MPLKDLFYRAGAAMARMIAVSFFLPRCRLCDLHLVQPKEKIICSDCREKIRLAAEKQCQICGKFIPDAMETCGSCLLQTPPFLRHVAYAAYEGTLREVIILYKYGEVEALKKLLVSLYLEILQKKLPGPFHAVVPVPADRRRRHGFRPVWTMARLLARELKVEFWPGLLQKNKSTLPQVGLSQARRKTNLNGAFVMAGKQNLAGKRILLIDDVITTGTTVRKCAALLSQSGARVSALTLAQSRF